MRFSQFLTEMGQVVSAEEPGENLILKSEVNSHLENELNGMITSPEVGIQKIRKVLFRYGLDLSALYDIAEEGDEFAIEVDDGLFLYVLYYLTDEGNYDFYAEVTDWDGVDELMSDEEEKEEK